MHQLTFSILLSGTYLTWEGQQQNIYFPDSGVTVQTHIDWNAKTRDFTAYAGWAQRDPPGGKVFNCYRVSVERVEGLGNTIEL